jgi:hypothetical protein
MDGVMRRAFLLFTAAVVLAGSPFSQAQSILDKELELLLGWVVGEFDNQLQRSRGENVLLESRPDPSKAPDLLFPVFARVEAPALGRHVIYLQWPLGRPQGVLQRQRIWTFEVDQQRNAVLMNFFILRDAGRWRDAHLRPTTALLGITREDVVPYPAACRLTFRRHIDVFVGEIPRGDCRIVSQQTRTDMTINAKIVIARDELWYDESGVRQDGSIVFKVPAEGSYQFRRR